MIVQQDRVWHKSTFTRMETGRTVTDTIAHASNHNNSSSQSGSRNPGVISNLITQRNQTNGRYRFFSVVDSKVPNFVGNEKTT